MICSLFFHGIGRVGNELNCANNAKTQISGFFFPNRPVFERPGRDSRLKVKIKSRFDDHHDPTQKKQNKDIFFRERASSIKLNYLALTLRHLAQFLSKVTLHATYPQYIHLNSEA